jgi:hypothetical protein
MSLKLIGMAAIADALTSLGDAKNYAGDISESILAEADSMRDTIKSEAPQGPTGNLKKSVQSGLFKARQGKPIAGFVRVNRRTAPHAHLVEFGARSGRMPSNSFFARGVAKSKGPVLDKISDKIAKAIDGIWNGNG